MTDRFDSELERLLAGRLDGDLTPAESERLRELLATDEAASHEAESLARLDRLVRAEARRQPRVDWSAFRADVMTGVKREADRRLVVARVYRLVSWTAPLAAAAAIAVAFLLPESAPRPVPTPNAHPAAGRVIEVAYHRPAAPSGDVGRTVRVEFSRSAEMDRAALARDNAVHNAATLAVASSSRPIEASQLLLGAWPL